MKIRLFVAEITDKWVRENFRKLDELVRKEPIFRGDFAFFEITAPAVTTSRDYVHNLGFRPKDVLTLSVSGGYDVTWHYDSFTDETVRFSTSGPCTVRAYIGRHEEG